MTSLINFRDFGGMANVDGSIVRSGLLFRSGHLGSLDAADTERLEAMAFALVVDLRYPDERRKEVSPWPEPMRDRVIFHDHDMREDAPHLAITRAAAAGEVGVDDAYLAFYAALPFDPSYRTLFATAIARIAEADGPVLVHCTAGKDRTGTLVALLHAVLGVTDADIAADYMRSEGAPGMATLRHHVRERMLDPATRVDEAVIDALIGVKPIYIAAALDAVRARSGSVEAYLAEGGVPSGSLDILRKRLLSPSPTG